MDNQIFADVFGFISQNSGRGAQSTGQVADWLIGAGLSAAAITQLLNGIATSAQTTPDMIAYVQNELRYLQQPAYEPRNNWLPILIIGGLVWFATRRD